MGPLRTLYNRFTWIHNAIGLFGNLSFFVGSILFLYPDPVKRVGVWLFIFGSLGMFIGSIGNSAVIIEHAKLREKYDRDFLR